MGINHPISGRQARKALGATQFVVNKQAEVVVSHERELEALRPVVAFVGGILTRGFFGRLKWLAVGR
jgi:hypothetical protein